MHTAWNVYKTVRCLLSNRSFPAQSQLYNIRETIFRTFFSCCCGIFDQVNDSLVAWCLILAVIMFWLMFCQYRHLLAQSSTTVSENDFSKVALMLLCCHWACKCLMGCLASGSTWNYVSARVFVTALLSVPHHLYSRT